MDAHLVQSEAAGTELARQIRPLPMQASPIMPP
jgi:hypothetical protein